ncbi:MAG: GAP family protein [Propionibacteriaceae bacterium]|nr:GAP family protein [Propionibacteriaceae bacterium]
MTGTITSVLLLSGGVAISPLPILAVIGLLLSKQSRATSLPFAGGWLGGIVLVVVVGMGSGLASRRIGPEALHGAAAVVGVSLGSVAILAGALIWFRRPVDATAGQRDWLGTLDALSPSRALAVGGVLSAVNPKNLLASGTAGLILGWSSLTGSAIAVAGGAFCLLAGSTVVIPVVVHSVGGGPGEASLVRLREWLVPRQAAVLSVLLVGIGLILAVRGGFGI